MFLAYVAPSCNDYPHVKFHASLSNCDAIYECPAAGLAVQPQPARLV